MNVTVEKVKVVKATETPKPDTKIETPAVETPVVETPAVEAKTEIKPNIIERIETALAKMMGSYDGKYQEVPGVPGTEDKKAEEAPEGGEKPEGEKLEEGNYDGQYQACPHCGQKMKKAEEPEMKPEKEEKKAEEVLPTKAETSAEKPDLSIEAWRSNFFSNGGIQLSPRNVDWAKACEAFTSQPSKQ